MFTKTFTMKPSVTLDEKTGVHVVQQQNPSKVSPKRKWLKYAGLCLLFIFLTTVTVFVLMIYNNTKASGQEFDTDLTVNINGAEKTEQSEVEVNVTYHIVPSGKEIKENIHVSGQEEIISTPKAKMIYDFRSGYFITKFTNSDDDMCYVNDFNVTGSIDGIRLRLVKETPDQFVYENLTEVVYESTNDIVNKTLLSPRASAMCANSKVIMFQRIPATGGDTSKRIKRECNYEYIEVCKHRTVRTCRQTCTKGFWWGKRRCQEVCSSTMVEECSKQKYYTC